MNPIPVDPPASEAEAWERTIRVLERLDREVNSTDPRAPGLAMRLDRLERRLAFVGTVISWLMGGNLLGFLGAIVLLWKILEATASRGI